MRIVSLLPSTTEILFGIGAGNDVVGVTFECDYPPEARGRRIVSTSAMPEGLSPHEIDEFVTAALARGEDLYHLEADALYSLDADIVVTQDLCAVCAVDVSVVVEALSYLGCSADVITIDPHNIGEVLNSLIVIGERTGHLIEAESVVDRLRARLDVVRHAVTGLAPPRVLVLEWTDPPFAPGHWIPEMHRMWWCVHHAVLILKNQQCWPNRCVDTFPGYLFGRRMPMPHLPALARG
jgi:iron complex transport system substrate-binding protein